MAHVPLLPDSWIHPEPMFYPTYRAGTAEVSFLLEVKIQGKALSDVDRRGQGILFPGNGLRIR